MSDLGIPENRAAITAEWVEKALEKGGMIGEYKIVSLEAQEMAEGVGFMGELTRLDLTYETPAPGQPASVVVKMATRAPENFGIAKNLFFYSRECGFYRHLAEHAPVRVPHLYYADFDEESHHFVLVLEYLGHMETPDQIKGANGEQSRRAIREIAKLHGVFWGKVDEGMMTQFFDLGTPQYGGDVQFGYGAYLPATLEHFGEHFTPETRRLAEDYAPRVAAHLAALAQPPRTFIHGDFRLDNMFFGDESADPFALVDWQISGRFQGIYDVAYFLSASVSTEVRREIEREALAEYHDTVCSAGATDYSFEDCWQDYRKAALAGLLVPIFVCGGLDLGNERGREFATVGLKRALAAVTDLEAAEFLPE